MDYLDKLKLVQNMWKNYAAANKGPTADFKKKIGNALDITKLQSLDSLIQLETMPEATTQLLIKVISLYKKGGLKGQKEVHGKHEIKFSSSSLITLQGLDVDERHELLLKVQNKIQTWDEMLNQPGKS